MQTRLFAGRSLLLRGGGGHLLVDLTRVLYSVLSLLSSVQRALYMGGRGKRVQCHVHFVAIRISIYIFFFCLYVVVVVVVLAV